MVWAHRFLEIEQGVRVTEGRAGDLSRIAQRLGAAVRARADATLPLEDPARFLAVLVRHAQADGAE